MTHACINDSWHAFKYTHTQTGKKKSFTESDVQVFHIKTQLYVASHMTHHLTESQVSLPLSGLCNPEPAEASWRGGRQQRPSVVCVFSLVPCHKTVPPKHPRVPMCTVLRLGTRGSLKHLYSPTGSVGETPVFCQRPRHNSIGVWKGFFFFFVAAGSLHKHAINLNWSSSVEHRKTFSAPRQQCCSPELHKIETDLGLS